MKSTQWTFEAYLDSFQLITILLPKDYYHGTSSVFHIETDNIKQELQINSVTALHSHMKYECMLPLEISLRDSHFVIDERGNKAPLYIGAIIRTEEFDNRFYYDKNDLGATYKEEETLFKIWSPVATDVRLLVYNFEKQIIHVATMKQGEKGTWYETLSGNWEGYLYRYAVTVNEVENIVVDPYAKSLSVNSEYGYIIDSEKIKKFIITPLYRQFKKTDAVIYETSIRDFTMHPSSGVAEELKGTYKGFTVEKTKTKDGYPTCFSYVKNMGVTHIEILPVNDFAGIDERDPHHTYNWGYNPLFYFVPEGSYSLLPNDPYARIFELKQLIKDCHDSKLGVILDVVYNHVYHLEESNLHKIVPGYYFRYNQYGMPSNGTGVGNDLATERKMVKKLVVDSVKYFVEEFGIDGLRFDLMGILTIECLREIEAFCQQSNYAIMLFGEGWNLPTSYNKEELSIIENACKLPNIGYFNDVFRQTIRGNIFDFTQKGYILGNESSFAKVQEVISGSISCNHHLGSFFCSPEQTINYVECHDNSTLWDHILASNDTENEEIRKMRQLLATSIVILSQGVPFLHSGQEFFRTKNGIENSYQSSDDINAIKWDTIDENKDFVECVKQLIALRRSHKAFRFSTIEEVQKHVDFLNEKSLIIYQLLNVGEFGPAQNIIVVWNASTKEQNFVLPLCENDWYNSYHDGCYSFEKKHSIKENSVQISPLSVTILFS